MIRVSRSAIPTPPSVAGAESAGAGERKRATEFYAIPANRANGFSFTIYKAPDVKDAVEALFHRKCAYCESPYAATQPVDVEHFRPKGGVTVDGRLERPGYYWLAADWYNLLPSCIDCNRRRTQEFPDAPPELTGKANLFPIEDEGTRARHPGDENGEKRLLFDPCRDFPERSLEFLEQGVVRPRRRRSGSVNPKAVASIEVYGLQRKNLVDARRARALLVLQQVTRVNKLTDLLVADPANAAIRSMLNDETDILRTMIRTDQPYTALTRQLARKHLRFVPAFLEGE